MIIPYSRFIAPAVVVVVVFTAYVFIAHPFAKDPTISTEATIQDYRTRANAHLEKKEYKEALELLLKLEEMAPEDLAVHYSVARLYQSSGMKIEARAALERGIPYLNDPDANTAYAKLLSELE